MKRFTQMLDADTIDGEIVILLILLFLISKVGFASVLLGAIIKTFFNPFATEFAAEGE